MKKKIEKLKGMEVQPGIVLVSSVETKINELIEGYDSLISARENDLKRMERAIRYIADFCGPEDGLEPSRGVDSILSQDTEEKQI